MQLLGAQNSKNLSENFVRICEKDPIFWQEVSDLRARIRFGTLTSELENTDTELQASIYLPWIYNPSIWHLQIYGV